MRHQYEYNLIKRGTRPGIVTHHAHEDLKLQSVEGWWGSKVKKG